jgi:hypothetical protein
MMSFLTRRGVDYAQRIYGSKGIPSVRALQRSIELSWRDGFDVEGAEQLVRNRSVRLLACVSVCSADLCLRRFTIPSIFSKHTVTTGACDY